MKGWHSATAACDEGESNSSFAHAGIRQAGGLQDLPTPAILDRLMQVEAE